MKEPRVLYSFMEEMIENQDYTTALEIAKELDSLYDNNYYQQYVITKQQVMNLNKDKILEEYYKFGGGKR